MTRLAIQFVCNIVLYLLKNECSKHFHQKKWTNGPTRVSCQTVKERRTISNNSIIIICWHCCRMVMTNKVSKMTIYVEKKLFWQRKKLCRSCNVLFDIDFFFIILILLLAKLLRRFKHGNFKVQNSDYFKVTKIKFNCCCDYE